MDEIRNWLETLIGHYVGAAVSPLYALIMLGVVLGFAIVVEVLLRLLFMNSLPRMLSRLFKKKDGFVNKKVVSLTIRICSVSIFAGLLSIPFPEEDDLVCKVLYVVIGIYTTILVVRLIGAILSLTRSWMLSSPKYRNNPFVNLLQVINVIVIFLAGLLIVSLVFGIDMKTLFGSLAALSAVLMLVFKDTLMGLVAGIQLSGNDMIRVGDWITSPKHGVDGDVMDISLTTVKVRAYDNTVYTIPPYALVSDPVINWRPMQATGARRCKRSLFIDIRSVRYADDDLINKLRHSSALGEYIQHVTAEIDVDNTRVATGDDLRKRRLTNLGLFRRYVLAYLKGNPRISQSNTVLVRQREATEKGIPLELYFFTDTAVWIEFEDICSDVFDHMYSVAYQFDLNFFQNLGGRDIRTSVQVGVSEAPKPEPPRV